jgi:hypothetical protein
MPEPALDTAFPAGNLLVEGFDGAELTARPDLRDTAEPWFWWCFRVRDPGPALTVRFTRPFVLGPQGPACSEDGGATWRWLGPGAVSGDGFRWERPADCAEVRFALAPPYTLADWRRYADARPGLGFGTLCLTRRGRAVPMVRLGDPAAPAAVLVTARHHACECAANWVLEGLLDGLAAVPGVRVLAVPLVDLDGVEDGDQGKSRRPHDHNRDYSAAPIHPEVAAIQAQVPAWARGGLRFGIDLHCPWLRDRQNEHIYIVGSGDPVQAAAQARFADAWAAVSTGDLPVGPHRILPFGTAWNTRVSGTRCADFVARLGGIGLSIEIPYAGARPDGHADIGDPDALVPATPDRLRRLGASLARAVAATLA